MKRDTLEAINTARAAKTPIVVVTKLATGEQTLFPNDRHQLSGEVIGACERALGEDRGGTLELDGQSYFIHPFNPPLRMLVVGAVHITQALVPMAAVAGYDVTVVDPRRAFASHDRFPGVHVMTEWPDEAFEQIGIDARTAVVTLTHDPKIDDPALDVALRSPAFYIGSLGSKKTHAARINRLKKHGLDAVGRERICGPIGLAIGAKSPAEIAISIMAQVTEALRLGAPRALTPKVDSAEAASA
ncbi:MAG: XdhC family protein [Pseudomonadota bacterium]